MATAEQAPRALKGEAARPGAQYLGVVAVMLYGCLTALLYVSLMPLWEGFDEPFHYGYVYALSRWRELPVLNRTPVPKEVSASFELAPASHIVKRNLPMARSYAEYFALPDAERSALRGRLDLLKGTQPPAPNDPANYEAQQPPLAYALLAPADWLWSGVPLPERIWRLRLLAALAAVLATGSFTWLLARELGASAPWPEIAVFLVLSSQMFYATAAHIANDWLAVALMAAFGWAAVRFATGPSVMRGVVFGLILAAGLLTKASFLALLPAAVLLTLAPCWRGAHFISRAFRRPVQLVPPASLGPAPAWPSFRLAPLIAFAVALLPAVPWYARNLLLYDRLSGLIEPRGGATPAVMLSALFQIDWLRANAVLLRSSFWMGNNSNLMLSGATVDVMLALLAAGALLYLLRLRRGRSRAPRVLTRPADGQVQGPVPAPEHALLSALCWFGIGLVYATALNFVQCEGVAASAAPWYAFGVVPWLACLLVLGLADGGRLGRAVASLTILAWAYVMSITFWLKLIPLYSGYQGRARPVLLFDWYRHSAPLIAERLHDVALIRPPAIIWLAGFASLFSLLLAAAFIRSLWAKGETPR